MKTVCVKCSLRGAVLVGLLAFGLSKVWAGSFVQGGDMGSGADPLKTFTVTANTANVNSLGNTVKILGIKINTTSAGGICGFYDTLTINGTSAANLFDELQENTTTTTTLQMWPKPWNVARGVTILATNAACMIYY